MFASVTSEVPCSPHRSHACGQNDHDGLREERAEIRERYQTSPAHHLTCSTRGAWSFYPTRPRRSAGRRRVRGQRRAKPRHASEFEAKLRKAGWTQPGCWSTPSTARVPVAPRWSSSVPCCRARRHGSQDRFSTRGHTNDSLRIGPRPLDTAVDARSLAQKQWCEHLHASQTHPPHTSKYSRARRGRRLTGNRHTRATAVHGHLRHAAVGQCSKRAVARRHVRAAWC